VDGFSRLLKNGASSRDPEICGLGQQTAHPAFGGAALSETPLALAGGLVPVFQPSDRGAGKTIGKKYFTSYRLEVNSKYGANIAVDRPAPLSVRNSAYKWFHNPV
jgi:hypothetical protein